MSNSEVKCLCAHMCFWKEGLDQAVRDCGITVSLSEAVEHLRKAKWLYDEKSDSLVWLG